MNMNYENLHMVDNFLCNIIRKMYKFNTTHVFVNTYLILIDNLSVNGLLKHMIIMKIMTRLNDINYWLYVCVGVSL